MVSDCLKNSGAIAQLGERLNGIQEVTGSIPVSSTILTGQRQAKPFNEPAIRSGWRVFCCPPQAAAIRHRRWSRRETGPELLSSLRGRASQQLAVPAPRSVLPRPAPVVPTARKREKIGIDFPARPR